MINPDDLRCSGCGGPVTARQGQHMIIGVSTITFDSAGRVAEQTPPDGAWCGDCLEEWDRRLGLGL